MVSDCKTFDVIAEELGLSLRQVHRAFRTGLLLSQEQDCIDMLKDAVLLRAELRKQCRDRSRNTTTKERCYGKFRDKDADNWNATKAATEREPADRDAENPRCGS